MSGLEYSGFRQYGGYTSSDAFMITEQPYEETGDIDLKDSSTEISILIAGVASAVCAIIYALKHIKHSQCCLGLLECDQQTQAIEINKVTNV